MSYFGVAGRHMSQGQKTATAVGSGFTLSQDEKRPKVPRLDLEKRYTEVDDYNIIKRGKSGMQKPQRVFR